MTNTITRTSRFAGSFYPGTEKEIGQTLDVLREKAGDHGKSPHPPILVLPHAGWIYSGLAAMRGLSTLTRTPPSRVVLIGPSHRHYFLGFSPAGYEKYETPLGELTVDLDLQRGITDRTGFEFVEEAHVNEHSLEVILPMLQYTLKSDFKILPILAGSVSRATIEQLADVLAGLMNPLSDILVVSSDLSHFYSYDEARSLDQETVNFILDGKDENLLDRSGEGGRLACGYGGLAVAVILARKWELEKPELLIYYNSGDSGGDRKSVVGYASIAWPAPDLG